MRPFLKWPGGKYRLLHHLQASIPQATYLIEPFVGAGAVFLNAPHPKVIVNDINPDLINLYTILKENGNDFIKQAKKWFIPQNNKAKIYYDLRNAFNQCDDPWQRSLIFLYLNRHGYNGLCRYNMKGFYNVPFGNYQQPYFPQKELAIFLERSKTVKFYCEDYVHLLKRFLKKQSLQQYVFYCDPPYAPLSKTANFTGYASNQFTLADQAQLAEMAQGLAKKGASVILSNHDTPFIREIYKGASIESIMVRRNISCQIITRNKVKEIIAFYSPAQLNNSQR